MATFLSHHRSSLQQVIQLLASAQALPDHLYQTLQLLYSAQSSPPLLATQFGKCAG